MEEDFYKAKFIEAGIKVHVPPSDDRKYIHTIINTELIKSIFLPTTRKKMLEIFDQLKNSGAGLIVLGCTEIPLLITQADYDLPLLNTLDLHTDAIVDFMLKD